MNIDDMPAGPEMDRLVAEGPMGWTRVSCILVNDEEETEHYETGGPRGAFGESNLRSVDDFSPTTNIAHAWEVVEKMRAARWIDIQDMRSYYDVSIRATADTVPCCATADTAPLAICRAALKAVGA